jgi:hypothetical protein
MIFLGAGYVAWANSSVHGGDPFKLNYDNNSNVWMQADRLLLYRSMVMSNKFKAVFGSAFGTRAKVVSCGQMGSECRGGSLDYIAANFGKVTEFFHAGCTAPVGRLLLILTV